VKAVRPQQTERRKDATMDPFLLKQKFLAAPISEED
jgi:hypothetical protein